MALTATVRRFEIDLSDSDRGVYERLELRVAQHPSESDRYLVARVIARCLEHGEHVDFTRGLAEADEPAIWARDLTGTLLAWIEIGAPSVERLHKASKTGARVAVYAWRGAEELARKLLEEKAHRAREIEIVELDGAFLDSAAARLDRTNRWELAVSGGALYLTIGGALLESSARRIPVPV